MKEAGNERKINHIGIIMDGNRRFSKRLMLEPWKGHEFGAKKVREVMQWCKDKEIKILTLYAFSYENFNRPKNEFDFLMKLFAKEFQALLDKPDELMDNGIKVRFAGKIEMFPENIRELMGKISKLTENNNNFIVNFAMAYSGRLEIIDAVKKMMKKGINADEIDEAKIIDNLYINSEPEIIIRTGGERRLSNFMTFQSVYSELFFVDRLWPEFTKDDYDKVIAEFNSRERRFGR